MVQFDLTSVEGRLALVDNVFTYPEFPHCRKHGPQGYDDYKSYGDWIRDEFSYRCAFTLFRETWPGFSFHIDHLIPQIARPDLSCSYQNLIYLEGRKNMSKGKRLLPDPCSLSLRACLHVHVRGERMGEIEALNSDGRTIITVLRLDGWRVTEERRKILIILRAIAHTDESTFKEFIGYPTKLPDLFTKRGMTNTKPEGLYLSAKFLQDQSTLPEWI